MNKHNTLWYEIIDRLIGRSGLSRPQVAQRAGVNTKTITSWLRGDVQSPRNWRPIVRTLYALQATSTEANQVLQGAGHPPVHRLVKQATGDEKTCLEYWLQPDAPFMAPDRLVANLVGRTAEMAQAVEALKQHRRCMILGMAGVGKTTLAVELAHLLRHDYPDGVFWGDLRTGVAEAVLESWGQACGVALERITDFNSRAAAMRAVFARKQALIILDDVVDSRPAVQMMPPQNLQCAVLVTTRSADVARALTKMQPGMEVPLAPMSRDHSLALLAGILGEDVVAEAMNAAGRVAELLGDMPLALHICAALCLDAGLSLGQMAVLLRDLRTRLEHLRLDERPLVRLAFEQSWDLLEERTQQGFAILAVFAGRPFHASAFAACASLSAPEAALLLTRLCRRSLLAVTKKAGTGSSENLYQQHTLLAAFSAEKLTDDDPAWSRFSNYYGRLVAKDGWWKEAMPETWGNVMAGMVAAHRLHNWPLLLNYSAQLSEAWRRQGLYSLARDGYSLAIDAAQETADPLAEADIRLEWGRAFLEQSAYDPSRKQLNGALTLYEQQAKTNGIAEAHYHLSRVEMEQSNHDAAEAAIQQAYQAYQQDEDVNGMSRALYRLGYIVYFQGDYERAARLAADAIRSQETLGDDLGLLRSHRLATQVFIQLNRVNEAEHHGRLAGNLVEKVGDQAEAAAFYYTYADVLRKQHAFVDAQEMAQKALALFQEMADGSSEVNALMLLAAIEVDWNEVDSQRQLFETGLAYCAEGLAVSEAVGYEVGKAFIWWLNGRLLSQQGYTAEACAIWTKALAKAQALQHTWLQQRLQLLINETQCGSNPLPNRRLAQSLAP